MKDLIHEARDFLERFASATEAERASLRVSAHELARQLRDRAIDLCYSKATEFSPEIKVQQLLAAKVALCLYGAGTPELEPFEGAIYYYRDFPDGRAFVEEYEEFKRRGH